MNNAPSIIDRPKLQIYEKHFYSEFSLLVYVPIPYRHIIQQCYYFINDLLPAVLFVDWGLVMIVQMV